MEPCRQRQSPRRLVTTCVAFGILSCLAVIYLAPMLRPVGWVGVKDLQVTFHLQDAKTSQPVRDARVTFLTRGSSEYAADDAEPATVAADSKGTCTRLFKQCLTHGRSGYDITYFPPSIRNVSNGWHIEIPDCFIRASAPGYETTQPTCIASEQAAASVRCSDPYATLDFWIRLKHVDALGQK
jgi:hypothetical protein